MHLPSPYIMIPMQSKKEINLAILSSFTIRGIEEGLRLKCQEIGIAPNIYVGGYNQYAQEILNPESGLYKTHQDVVVLFIDIRALLGEQFFFSYQFSGMQRREWVKEKIAELESLVFELKKRLSAKIIIHNFEVPMHTPLGILENKQDFGLHESIRALNDLLRDAHKTDSQVFVFDYDAFCSKTGKRNIIDYKMYYLGDVKLHFSRIPELCEEYLAYVKPLMSLNRKCLVLDLDNTLWGGVIGEEGLGGIKLGPTPEGRPFWEFQKYLLSLFQRGIILTINSKNNPEDALRVFREHPHAVLKEEHFAATKINWDDKVSNMRALAEEINLGIESFVFIDDDHINRDMVRKMLPEVKVVDFPEDPALYVKIISELDDFHTLTLTDEDKERGKTYATERQRKEVRNVAADLNEYLRNLQTVVTIDCANPITIPRIAQLIAKTNQFNMTTRRYTEEQVRELTGRPDFLIVSLSARDRFGDNGIVGVAIVEKGSMQWRIDTFLLSCRVIGRRIEETLLAYIADQASKEGAGALIGEFIPTGKNMPAKGFYANNGFTRTSSTEAMELWEYDLSKGYSYPDLIQLAVV